MKTNLINTLSNTAIVFSIFLAFFVLISAYNGASKIEVENRGEETVAKSGITFKHVDGVLGPLIGPEYLINFERLQSVADQVTKEGGKLRYHMVKVTEGFATLQNNKYALVENKPTQNLSSYYVAITGKHQVYRITL